MYATCQVFLLAGAESNQKNLDCGLPSVFSMLAHPIENIKYLVYSSGFLISLMVASLTKLGLPMNKPIIFLLLFLCLIGRANAPYEIISFILGHRDIKALK